MSTDKVESLETITARYQAATRKAFSGLRERVSERIATLEEKATLDAAKHLATTIGRVNLDRRWLDAQEEAGRKTEIDILHARRTLAAIDHALRLRLETDAETARGAHKQQVEMAAYNATNAKRAQRDADERRKRQHNSAVEHAVKQWNEHRQFDEKFFAEAAVNPDTNYLNGPQVRQAIRDHAEWIKTREAP